MDSEVRTRCVACCIRKYALYNVVHVDIRLFDTFPQAAAFAAEHEICFAVRELLQYFVLMLGVFLQPVPVFVYVAFQS